MKDRIQYVRDRFRYPSAEDAKDALRKLMPPSVLLSLAGMVEHVAPAKAQVIAHLGEDAAKTIDDLSKKARVLAVPGIAAAGILFTAISSQERKNRVQFGDYLTGK